jgi:dolichol-phosphate mannosyltransferase
MKKEVLININKLREHDRYIIWLIWWVWFSHTKQDIIHGKRIYGQSKYNFYSQLKLALNAIFSFSNYPLRLIIKIWLMFVLISIIYIITIIYNKIYLWEALLWWTSLIASIFLIWWIQIITMWVIWEYIWRSYIENKKRPLYIIKYNTYE